MSLNGSREDASGSRASGSGSWREEQVIELPGSEVGDSGGSNLREGLEEDMGKVGVLVKVFKRD